MVYRVIIILLSFFLYGSASATNYYFSTSGDDATGNGTQANPYKTITKLNSLVLVAGDNVYLKRGDVFTGTIIVSSTEDGNSTNKITFGAYSTGAKPIVTSFITLTGWVNIGGNIWETLANSSPLSYLRVVLIDGVNTPMGRYPNTGWFTYQSASGNTSITSSSVNSATTNWTGAQIVLKKERWATNTGTITAHSGGTLSYTDNGIDLPQVGYGFFIQNDFRTLDQQNEWYYTSNKKLQLYSTTAPANVSIPTLDSLMVINGDYVTVQNIEFKGANNNAIKILNNSNTIIDSCVVNYTGDVGVLLQGSVNSTVQNSYVHHTNGNAIRTDNNTAILSSTVRNASMIYGLVQTYSFGAVTGSNGSLIQYNNVDSSAYNGIMLNGRTNATVANNYINNSCLLLDDGGGIYTSLSGSNTVIRDNIVLNTRGSTAGNASPDAMSFGIYLDSYSTGITVQRNTVSGSGGAGGFFSNASNILVRDNTFFDNSKLGGFSGQSEIHIQHICCQLVRTNNFYNNVYYSKDASKYSIFFYSITDDVNQFGLADSNYFVNPLLTSGANMTSVQVGGTITNRTFAGWKTYTGQDTHSQVVTYYSKPAGDVRFEFNETNSVKNVTLPYKYLDAKGVAYNSGTIALQPYTSAVLLKNGALDNIPPVIDPVPSQTIQLPVNKFINK